ncbi:MAG: hypothetical protein ABEK29_03740, partial [Bradymonadaceae bacterium]
MGSESTGLTAGLFAVTLVVAPSLGCDSGKFSDAPRAEAPDEPMVDRQKTRQKRRPNRREGQTEMPSNHPPVGGAQGEQDRGGGGQRRGPHPAPHLPHEPVPDRLEYGGRVVR